MTNACWHLQLEIEEFIETWAQDNLADDTLTETEWETITKIKVFLEKLKMLTTECGGHNSTLDIILPSMDYMLPAFEKGKEIALAKLDLILTPLYNSRWEKMEKSFALADQTPVYIAAVILHTSLNWRYFNCNCSQEWRVDG
ncbi:transposase-like protein [Calycina marina]|uniref:Transposase-like protein n=1 Tax=Calycina marina TaxID=1763456 RepID=A0A9P7YWS9_9HELO|nr:transposase-like protein [Calycina marina]